MLVYGSKQSKERVLYLLIYLGGYLTVLGQFVVEPVLVVGTKVPFCNEPWMLKA